LYIINDRARIHNITYTYVYNIVYLYICTCVYIRWYMWGMIYIYDSGIHIILCRYMIILKGPPRKTLSTDKPSTRRFCSSAPAATVHYGNEPDWRIDCHSSITTFVAHSLVDRIVLSPAYMYVYFRVSLHGVCICVCVRESIEWIRAFVYIHIIIIFSTAVILSSSWLLYSHPFCVRRVSHIIIYTFPFSCRRRHRFPMGVQSITLARNVIALVRHVYHWSRARSDPPRDMRRTPFPAWDILHTQTHTHIISYISIYYETT